MEFLCPNHRQQFADLPLDERKDLRLFWMENAHACSEQWQWRDVISLQGDPTGMEAVILRAPECLQHPDFFADYLNWLSFPLVPVKRATMVRTLH